MKKQKQMQIVEDIVKRLEPIRTEQVKIEAMRQGVSCADRFLRWLQQDGKIRSYKAEKKDKTKTWVTNKPPDTTMPQEIARNEPESIGMPDRNTPIGKDLEGQETANTSENDVFEQTELFI